MIIKFSMDCIKNMDQIYTWTPIRSEDFGCDRTKECYHMIKMVGCLKILKRILFTILVEG